VIKPSSDDYYASTDVVQQSRWCWVWTARLCQPRPWTPHQLADAEGTAFTKKRAQRKADQAARAMMRAAKSWTSRTYNADGTEEAA
jgi:hypothetical protein